MSIKKLDTLTENALQYKKDPNEDLLRSILDDSYKLIYKVAYKYNIQDHDIDDLVQIGFLTVLHCIDLYDSTKDVKFATYLYTAIENKYQRIYNYYNRKKRTADIISLDTPVNRPGQKTTFIADVVPSDESIEEIVEEKFNRKTLEIAINNYIDKYPKRKHILEQLLHEVNLSEVARNVGVSRQRVSQIYNEFVEYAKNEYFE